MGTLSPNKIEQLKQLKELLLTKRIEFVNACHKYNQFVANVSDTVSINFYGSEQLNILDERIRQIDNLLENNQKEQISVNELSTIEIGTIFQATVQSEEENWTEKYQLLEELDDFEENDDIIPVSVQTSFGQSVYQKQVGSTFQYRMKNVRFQGTIDKIYKWSKQETTSKTR